LRSTQHASSGASQSGCSPGGARQGGRAAWRGRGQEAAVSANSGEGGQLGWSRLVGSCWAVVRAWFISTCVRPCTGCVCRRLQRAGASFGMARGNPEWSQPQPTRSYPASAPVSALALRICPRFPPSPPGSEPAAPVRQLREMSTRHPSLPPPTPKPTQQKSPRCGACLRSRMMRRKSLVAALPLSSALAVRNTFSLNTKSWMVRSSSRHTCVASSCNPASYLAWPGAQLTRSAAGRMRRWHACEGVGDAHRDDAQCALVQAKAGNIQGGQQRRERQCRERQRRERQRTGDTLQTGRLARRHR
jgi:hypothetical protein